MFKYLWKKIKQASTPSYEQWAKFELVDARRNEQRAKFKQLQGKHDAAFYRDVIEGLQESIKEAKNA